MGITLKNLSALHRRQGKYIAAEVIEDFLSKNRTVTFALSAFNHAHSNPPVYITINIYNLCWNIPDVHLTNFLSIYLFHLCVSACEVFLKITSWNINHLIHLLLTHVRSC